MTARQSESQKAFREFAGRADGGIRTLQSARLRAVQFHDKNTSADDREVDSVSAYANVDWDISDDWQLSYGGRYTQDSKDESQMPTT